MELALHDKKIFACVCLQFHRGGSVIQHELVQASGACNFTLRHSQPPLIHLLMPSDLPAAHRGHGLQSNGEMEGKKRRRREAGIGMGSLVYLVD